MSHNTRQRLFWLAGLTNIIGVPVFSAGFTNDYMVELYPAVFGKFSLMLIMLWGAAYISVASDYAAVPEMVLVFAVEKAVYVVSWLWWMYGHGGQLGAIFAKSFLTGSFYAIYGLIDLSYGFFFLATYLATRQRKPS